MKLNFHIIFDELSRTYNLSRHGTAREDLYIRAPRFYSEDCMDDYLYVVIDQLPPANCSAVLVCSETLADHFSDETPLILLPDGFDPMTIMNDLLRIFDEFRSWDRSLQDVVEYHQDLRVLADRGAQKIGCRLLVSDKNLRLLADSKFPDATTESSQDYQGRLLPREVVRAIKEESSHRMPSDQEYFAGADGRYEGRLTYNKDLFIGSRYEGTCTLMEADRPFCHSDFALFLHFFHYAHKLFLFYNGTRGKNSRALRTVLDELLSGKRLDQRLKTEAEHYTDDFRAYRCVSIRATDGDDLPCDYIMHLLESVYEDCICLLHQDDIVAFFPSFGQDIVDTLQTHLQGLGVAVGISTAGSRITDCRQLYLQATSAIEIGLHAAPAQQQYLFEDYLLPYLLTRSRGELSNAFLQTEGMKRLRNYNTSSSVDYLKTLKVYLDCEMNITHAAKALFLHRSSFLKRLEHLRELLGNELDTPEGRMLLRWQLYQ